MKKEFTPLESRLYELEGVACSLQHQTHAPDYAQFKSELEHAKEIIAKLEIIIEEFKKESA